VGAENGGVQGEGAEEERKAQWWANGSAAALTAAYVELNIKKKHTHRLMKKKYSLQRCDEFC